MAGRSTPAVCLRTTNVKAYARKEAGQAPFLSARYLTSLKANERRSFSASYLLRKEDKSKGM